MAGSGQRVDVKSSPSALHVRCSTALAQYTALGVHRRSSQTPARHDCVAEQAVGVLVHAAAGTEAGVVHRAGDIDALAQRILHDASADCDIAAAQNASEPHMMPSQPGALMSERPFSSGGSSMNMVRH